MALGGEVFWLGHQRKSGVGFAGRYNTDKVVGCKLSFMHCVPWLLEGCDGISQAIIPCFLFLKSLVSICSSNGDVTNVVDAGCDRSICKHWYCLIDICTKSIREGKFASHLILSLFWTLDGLLMSWLSFWKIIKTHVNINCMVVIIDIFVMINITKLWLDQSFCILLIETLWHSLYRCHWRQTSCTTGILRRRPPALGMTTASDRYVGVGF